ncbi:hypothetical protein BDZ89DRAFT_1043203 [Hymenopellis radicata]|nr:hypothetical protein BDZ89DRAFT_1043203 [Hymenopellis radicata]
MSQDQDLPPPVVCHLPSFSILRLVEVVQQFATSDRVAIVETIETIVGVVNAGDKGTIVTHHASTPRNPFAYTYTVKLDPTPAYPETDPNKLRLVSGCDGPLKMLMLFVVQHVVAPLLHKNSWPQFMLLEINLNRSSDPTAFQTNREPKAAYRPRSTFMSVVHPPAMLRGMLTACVGTLWGGVVTDDMCVYSRRKCKASIASAGAYVISIAAIQCKGKNYKQTPTEERSTWQSRIDTLSRTVLLRYPRVKIVRVTTCSRRDKAAHSSRDERLLVKRSRERSREQRANARILQKQDFSTAEKEDFTLLGVSTDNMEVVIRDVTKQDADATAVNAYLEVCGTVVDEHIVSAHTLISMPGDIDMRIIDSVIELIHEPRFRRIFFPSDTM